MIDLSGQTALVTGGARGIGRGCALALGQAGANVAINYENSAAAAATLVKEIEDLGQRAISVQADVGNPEQIEQMMTTVSQDLGRIDILVCNAGIFHGESQPAETFSVESWHRTHDVNLHGVWHCCRHVIPNMKENGYGRIVLMSSTSAHLGHPTNAPYATSKGALISLCRSLAHEVGPNGITINCISPGWIETDMTTEDLAENRENLIRSIAVKRIGRPKDIAGAVLFFASELGSFVTGQNLVVDGGDWPTGI